jgi:hypothetical protein
MAHARVYIARHWRNEAAEAYAKHLSPESIEYLKETESDFWLEIASDGKGTLLEIEDEG